MMFDLIPAFSPVMLASAFAGLVCFGLMFYFAQDRSEKRSRSDVKKRLDIEFSARRAREREEQQRKDTAAKDAAAKIARRANDFYANSDPANVRKLQSRLMQAGYMNSQAIGYFIASRFVIAVVLALAAIILVGFVLTGLQGTNKALIVLMAATIGYFLPNWYLNKKIKDLQAENRAGFPDVMDLMIVAAEAGLTMEASIDRIALEVQRTYPSLSHQLSIAGIEIRAGRPLDQALRAFGERLGLEEVQGFATMVQQSKELGTSVSDALRVYSEEMRHKRMMVAEERAYALPAKLSIPVTGFILPVVIGVAVLPTAVRMMNGAGG